jgi:hypothetical protein
MEIACNIPALRLRALPRFTTDGRAELLVVGRARLVVAEDGSAHWSDPPAWQETDTWAGEPGRSAPLAEHDFAPPKALCDVLVQAGACAPGGRPTPVVDVTLEGGGIDKRVRVHGARRWQAGLFGLRASDAESFVQRTLDWSAAFGGNGYAANPIGTGWCPREQKRAADGLALPATEATTAPVREPWGAYAPQGFGPLARSWAPRAALAGTYDAAWRQTRAPLLPDDFQAVWHQCAPPDQRIALPDGDVAFTCRNMTPAGTWQVVVPAFSVGAVLYQREAEPANVPMLVDTITLDPLGGSVALTWRTCFLLEGDFDAADALAVGPLSSGWHRARLLGKAWRPSAAVPLRSGA